MKDEKNLIENSPSDKESNVKSTSDKNLTAKFVEKEDVSIVGIGASAGGLDAMERFFKHVPPDSDIGFVVVQHLDPAHKSSLVELLSRYTSMKVVQVEDGVYVQPNMVYIIPPNKEMTISGGKLHLSNLEVTHRPVLPINLFFKSLANDKKDDSICIILSGYGADGTSGLKAIKSEGGMAMAQDPKTTESDSMPINAINTGLVDFILPPEEMPDKLIYYIKNSLKIKQKNIIDDNKTEKYIQKIFLLIRKRLGHDFTYYKKNTMYRRISKRASLLQIDNFEDYFYYMERNPDEIDHLFQELLINVTNFFRDPQAFEILKTITLPELIAHKSEGDIVRVWVAGCSTGEEVYSLAIIIREVMESLGKYFEVQIFGTDIDEIAIDIARKGVYQKNIETDVDQGRLKKFFIKKNGNYQIKTEMREMAIFAVHNVLKDPPFAKLDIISCRNLLIYLKSDAQQNLLSIFNYSLNIGGLLFLGPSESIGKALNSFEILDKKWKIFRSKKSHSLSKNLLESPIMFSPYLDRTMKLENLKIDNIDVVNLATKQLLDIYTPPSVLINDAGEILYIHGRMGKYLEPAPGEARLNIFDMAKEGIGFELRSAVQNAVRQEKDVFLEGLSVKNNGDSNYLNITVKPIEESGIMQNLLVISFEDVGKIEKKEKRIIKLDIDAQNEERVAQLEHELMETRERLKITIEEMETSYEELKAANEELQSMNEELQSTNEELETSKEEMQSINEELATVNSELQNKMGELVHANDDLKNLFNSTEMATIFLDKELNIRNFTPETTDLIKLRNSDIGRPIGDIVSNIKYDNLEEDIKKVLNKLNFQEKEIQTNEDKYYLMRITPYKTSDDVIDGVVIVFIDINQRKIDERKVQDTLEYSENIINTVREPLVVLDENLRVKSANTSFYKKFKVNENQTLGMRVYDLGDKQWDIPKLRELLESILPENKEFNDFEVVHEFPKIGLKKMILNARKVDRETTGSPLILLAIEDLSK